jgi:hypothetical protein
MKRFGHLQRFINPNLDHWTFVCLVVKDNLLLNIDYLLQNLITSRPIFKHLKILHKKNDPNQECQQGLLRLVKHGTQLRSYEMIGTWGGGYLHRKSSLLYNGKKLIRTHSLHQNAS